MGHKESMTEERRISTTVRLSESLKRNLDLATAILGRSQTQIIEEALKNFFDAHDIHTRYYLIENAGVLTLLETGPVPRIIEQKTKDGIPASEEARKYAEKLKMPVNVVHQG